METAIKISVVMPARNAGLYIREAIESVLNQTFADFELIVVDDGSTDDTAAIVRAFDDDRIALTCREPDFIAALNAGMHAAHGKYIARMDADDIMLPDRLQTQYGYMEAHPEVDLVAGGMQIFGEQNYTYSPKPGAIEWPDMNKENRIAHPTVMLRRESVMRMPELYRREYPCAEDYDLWLRMLETGMILVNLPDILIRYRTGKHQVTNSRWNVMMNSTQRLKSRHNGLLTVIIPFLNEGDEVEKTVQNIRETATGEPQIILINDCSTDETDYAGMASRYGCRYIRHNERKGVAASRDEGVAICETPFFILLDAHMEFYERGWDRRLASVLKDQPRSLVCLRSRVLFEKRENRNEQVAPTFGATLSMNETDILKCRWNYEDPNPAENLVDIEVPLGGAYASTRTYWLEIGGLLGLINYGMDEEMIALKIRRSGGRCLLIKDMVAGHLYRTRFPYPVTNEHILHNQILIAETLLEEEDKNSVLMRLKKKYPSIFDDVYKRVCEKKMDISF
jgi:glycosyltransferase involved in cell wall biosynthesis